MSTADEPVGRAGVRPARHALVLPPVALAGVAAVGVAGLAVWNPHTHHVPLCPFHSATGLWCPLCGGLRAVHDLTAGHLTAMLSDNLLVVMGLPLVLVWWWGWLRRATDGQPGAPAVRLAQLSRRVLWWSIAALVVAYTVVRNLPAGSFLAPAA